MVGSDQLSRVRIDLAGDQFAEMVEVQLKRWRDWPARFSCNPRGHVWPTPSLGYSSPADRERLDGTFPVLDRLAQIVVEARPLGGRFFVCEHGLWTFDETEGRKVQFAEFVLPSDTLLGVRCHEHAIDVQA